MSARRFVIALAPVLVVALTVLVVRVPAQAPVQRAFATPEEAVKALIDATKTGKLDGLLAIFGSGGQELAESTDAPTAKRNREIFLAAATERWHLTDQSAKVKILYIGNEDWPFPVPLVKGSKGWQFDAVAGQEEVLARRIGRNELAAIGTCRTYVAAQRHYAQQGHDGKPAGLFAATFRSDSGKQNGLYWPTGPKESRSPLGDLVAEASLQGRALGDRDHPAPYYGYYFKILTAQGAAAPGGTRSYLVNGDLSGGFALVAWPAQYDTTGVMTFIVNQDGIVYQKDLGPQTATAAAALTAYDPASTWQRVQ
jgi:hypothetical protein